MSLEFKDTHKFLDYFDSDFEHVILSTFEFDSEFIEENILPVLCHMSPGEIRTYPSQLHALEMALQNVTISVISSGQIATQTGKKKEKFQRRILGYNHYVYNGVQHSKIVILARKDLVRIILGSVNLTKAACCQNLETFAVFDFQDGAQHSVHFALDIIKYIELLTEGNVGLRQQIKSVTSWISRMRLPRRVANQYLLSYPNPNNASIFDMLKKRIGNDLACEITIVSPFFESERAEFFKSFVRAFRDDKRCPIKVYFPSEKCEEKSRLFWTIDASTSFINDSVFQPSSGIIFYPVTAYETGSHRYMHAKIILIQTRSKKYLLIGSSNFSKKGYGFGKNTVPNAEANILFVLNSRDVVDGDYAAKFVKYEGVDAVNMTQLCARRNEEENEPDDKVKGEDFSLLSGAWYANGVLRLSFLKQSDALKKWSISLGGRSLIEKRRLGCRQRICRISLPESIIAANGNDLTVQVNGFSCLYPISISDVSDVLKIKYKDYEDIEYDDLMSYWGGRIRHLEGRKPAGGVLKGMTGSGLIRTSELIGRVKKFIRSLECIRAYLDDDNIISKKMLKTRIVGLHGVEQNVFKILGECKDRSVKYFCYCELLEVIRDVWKSYGDKQKAIPLKEYASRLTKEADRNGKHISDEWRIYKKYKKI